MRCSGSFLVHHWSVHGRDCVVHAKMCVYMLPLLFHCVQGCRESRAAVASYSWINVALWRLGAVLNCHGLHLHHPQLPAGRHGRQHASTNAYTFTRLVKNLSLFKFLAYALKVIDDIIGVNKNINI